MLIRINGIEYPLSASLRVAYNIQRRYKNRPYMEIFEGISSSLLEEQITILYESFKIANKDSALSEAQFRDAIIDDEDYGILGILELIKELVERIMQGGLSDEEYAEKKRKMEGRSLEE